MRRWALRITAIAGISGAALLLLNELSPLRWHAQVFQVWAAHAWQSLLRKTQQRLYAYQHNTLLWREHKEILFLSYSPTGKLKAWNTTRWIFPQSAPSLISAEPEILTDEYTTYYALKLYADTLRYVALIPVQLGLSALSIYPRWDFPLYGDQEWIQSLCLKRTGGGYPVTLSNLRGVPVLRFFIHCAEPLRLPLRWISMGLLGIAMAGALYSIWHYIRAKYSQARLWYLALLVGVWQILHWTDVPGRFLPTSSFFSAEKVAISPFYTSLWDLAWTLGILLWATTLLPSLKVQKPWLYSLGFVGLWGAFGGSVYLLALHSQLTIDLSRDLGFFSLLCWGVVLYILRQTGAYLQRLPLSSRGIYFGAAGAGILIGAWIELPIWGILSLLALYFLPLSRRHLPAYLYLSAELLFIAGGVNGWIAWGEERKARRVAEVYALHVSHLREPALEYRISQILTHITADTVLWKSLKVEDYLIDTRFIALLIRRHLLMLGDRYEILVSCWKPDGMRVDNLFELQPLPWRQVQARGMRISSAPELYFLTRGHPRYFYVARVPIRLPIAPALDIQIELHPRRQLLISRIRATEKHSGPSYALYERNQLVRQWGEDRFPAFLPVPTPNLPLWRKTSTHYEYITSVSPTLTAFLRLPARDTAAHLAAIPIFLILLLLGILIQNSTDLLKLFRSLYRGEASFVQRFRALLSISIFLPLFVILSVTFIIFLRLQEEQREQELIQRLSTVGAYLSGEAVLLEKLSYWLESYLPGEESFVRDLMRRIGVLSQSEAFIYTAEGILYSSTLPVAYWNDLVSMRMQPAVLERMRQGETSTWVERDKRLGRLMGYAALRTDSGRLIGIVHIPLPIPSRAFYEPLRHFIGYTVNAYLFVSGVAMMVGFLLMERFSGRLQRVVHQLKGAPPSAEPPLLRWEGGKDEIATLVAAYNEMAEKLSASQRQLENTLRRVSQQEMAFQAAHEIRTALTPLKIHLQHLQRMPTVEPDKLREISTRLLQRIESLVRIADTFMSFARAGSSEALSLQPLRLNTFLEEQLQPFLQNPHVKVSLHLPTEPLWIDGNADALQQILNNILQNALQALEGTASPAIHVELSRRDSEALIAITDNGPGIPPEVQARIFEFYFTTRRTGTGLGLAITKALVEKMQGRITFKSALGEGTTFFIAFPLRQPLE